MKTLRDLIYEMIAALRAAKAIASVASTVPTWDLDEQRESLTTEEFEAIQAWYDANG